MAICEHHSYSSAALMISIIISLFPENINIWICVRYVHRLPQITNNPFRVTPFYVHLLITSQPPWRVVDTSGEALLSVFLTEFETARLEPLFIKHINYVVPARDARGRVM
jgi:hypothetical protein